MKKNVALFLILFAGFLALLIDGAHFLRFWSVGFTASFVSLIILSFFKYEWIRKLLITTFLFSTIMWCKVAVDLIQVRLATKDDWIRLAIILFGVAAYNLFCAYLFTKPLVKQRYSKNKESSFLSLITFCLVFLAFIIIHTKAGHILIFNRLYWQMGMLQGFLLSLWGAYVVHKLTTLKKDAPLFRLKIWRLFSTVFFLQLCLAIAGYTLFMLNETFHLPIPALIIASPIFRTEGYFMLILFTVSIAFIGSAWCSYLCYFGVWDAYYTKKIRPMVEIRKYQYFKLIKYSSLISLMVTISISYLLRIMGVSVNIALALALFIGLLIIPAHFLISRRYGFTSYCYVFCPLGAISTRIRSLFSIFSWKLRFADSCTHCGKCIKTCSYLAIDKEALKQKQAHSSCTLCLDCIHACSHNACFLELKPFTFSTKKAVDIFSVLISVFHSVFLGVAMV